MTPAYSIVVELAILMFVPSTHSQKKTIGDSAPNNVLFAREHKFQQSSNQTDDNIVVNKVVT